MASFIYVVTLIALPALHANSLPLAWNSSTNSSVTGYKIYYGVVSGVYVNSVDVGNVTNATINGLAPFTTYYFAAQSYDAFGDSSPFSNEINLMVYPPAAVSQTTNVNGQFTFNVSGAITYPYVVQSSTNLINWVSLQTNTSPFTFVDTNANQFSQRFYRTVNVN